MKKLITSLMLTLFILLSTGTARAQDVIEFGEPIEQAPQEETLEGKVIKIVEEENIKPVGGENIQLFQKLQVEITKGSLKGKIVTIDNGDVSTVNVVRYKPGDNLVIFYGKNFEGKDTFYITDYVRRLPLLILFSIFVVLATIIGGWQGLTSLFGMAVSFAVIFMIILPRISTGGNPIQAAILGSLIIIPVTFLLSHGINKKTIVAISGTIIALVLTGILATIFVEAANLSGFSTEEAGFLQNLLPGVINMKGLLLAGIIIGVLGVLDDITISQSAIVQELKKANPKLGPTEIYKRAMTVGKDHIASMVNTLILVYTGAALPLLLLFINNPHPFTEVINYEIIADEVVRTLIGSVGLIMAVPITTVIASLAFKDK